MNSRFFSESCDTGHVIRWQGWLKDTSPFGGARPRRVPRCSNLDPDPFGAVALLRTATGDPKYQQPVSDRRLNPETQKRTPRLALTKWHSE